jgi:hypothetical protein
MRFACSSTEGPLFNGQVGTEEFAHRTGSIPRDGCFPNLIIESDRFHSLYVRETIIGPILLSVLSGARQSQIPFLRVDAFRVPCTGF